MTGMLRSMLFPGVLALVGCTSAASMSDTGTPETSAADTALSGDTALTGDAAPTNDASADVQTGADATALDASGSETAVTDAAAPTDVPATGDASSTCDFQGTWHVVNIQCNGVPYTRLSAIMPPNGSWTGTVHGTDGVFNENIMGCTLSEHGRLQCDQPTAGHFQIDSFMPNSCAPASCPIFGSSCGTTPTRRDVWAYQRLSATQFLATSATDTAIATCTGAHQSNPIQVTWQYDGP